MAGIWQPSPVEEQGLQGTTAILTTLANALVAPLHDRMPLTLAPDRIASWLQEEAPDPELLASLRTPFPADEMEAVEVHPRVNDARNQGPDCLEESG